MTYVDAFVVPVHKSKLAAYKKLAKGAAAVFMKHGALTYVECVADDAKPGKVTSFPQSVKLKTDEVVVFAWMTFKSKAARNACWKKCMKDPFMANYNPKSMPFDGKRMFFGGFKPFVEV